MHITPPHFIQSTIFAIQCFASSEKPIAGQAQRSWISSNSLPVAAAGQTMSNFKNMLNVSCNSVLILPNSLVLRARAVTLAIALCSLHHVRYPSTYALAAFFIRLGHALSILDIRRVNVQPRDSLVRGTPVSDVER
jgi:hypothetical protein